MDEQIVRMALLRAAEGILESFGVEIDQEKGLLSADLQALPKLAPELPVERLIVLARAVSAARRLWPDGAT